MRRFVRKEMAPNVDAWEAANGFPRNLYRECGALGLLGLGHPEECGGSPNADIFHLLALTEELVIGGLCAGLAATLMTTYIATPPIRNLGTPEQKRRYRDNRVLGIGGGAKEIMNEIIARRMGL